MINLDSNALTDDEFMTRMLGIINNHQTIVRDNGQIYIPHYGFTFSKEDSERYQKLEDSERYNKICGEEE